MCPYVERDEVGVITSWRGTIDAIFYEARAYLSSGKLQERLGEYPHVHAEAARLGLSFDDAVADICARWPEWIDGDEDTDIQPGGSSDILEQQNITKDLDGIRDAYETSHAENNSLSLADLKESLRLRVIAEAVKQSGLDADVLARVIELTNTLNDETASEQVLTSAQLELEQHNEYREKATLVEAAKQRKLAEIDAIETVEDALIYSVETGWP